MLLERGSMTGKQIAEELGISESTASRDLAAIKEIWRAEMVEDVSAIVARDLALVEAVQEEAWAAWNDSLEVGDRTVTSADALDKHGEVRNLITIVERNPRANLGALKVIQSCVEQRRKILGLDKDVSSMGTGKAIVFTVKIGDRILVSEASDVAPEDVPDADFIELDSSGKALPAGERSE